MKLGVKILEGDSMSWLKYQPYYCKIMKSVKSVKIIFKRMHVGFRKHSF